MKARRLIIPLLVITFTGICLGQRTVEQIVPAEILPSDIPWDVTELSKPPIFKWVDTTGGVRSLLYEGSIYKGNPTSVFAFYTTPGTLTGDRSKDKNLPAVILLHGGGGYAFRDWAKMWAERGYAAIAINLVGGGGDYRHMTDGGPINAERFEEIDKPVEDQWPYHAVSNAIMAHSLVRSFDEVDPSRTAITGISWGGFLTCIVAGLDNRFSAAVPVYGCGFLHENSVWKKSFADLNPIQREKWVKYWDPSTYIGSSIVPIFFINGTNDGAFYLESYAKTYELVKSPHNLHIEAGMRHSHPDGWAPKEIELFINQYLNGGIPLPKILLPNIEDNLITAKITAKTKLSSAKLYYTTDATSNQERKWESLLAEIDEDNITAPVPPEGTKIWFLTVTDERDAMVSSKLVFE